MELYYCYDFYDNDKVYKEVLFGTISNFCWNNYNIISLCVQFFSPHLETWSLWWCEDTLHILYAFMLWMIKMRRRLMQRCSRGTCEAAAGVVVLKSRSRDIAGDKDCCLWKLFLPCILLLWYLDSWDVHHRIALKDIF